MGLFSSSSRTTATTNQTDNRRVIGEGAISAENSNVTYQTLDGAVVNDAFNALNQNSRDAFDFGANALNFGSNTVTKAINFGTDALGFAESAQNRSQQLAYNTITDALASNESAFKQALGFGGTLAGRALDSLESTETVISNAYADAKGRGALTDKILMGAIIAMAVVAFMAVKK